MYSLSASLANNLKMRSKTPLFAHRLKSLVYDVPIAKTCGQITPRDSRSISVKNRINEQPVVLCIATHMAFSAGQKIFDPLPLVVTIQFPNSLSGDAVTTGMGGRGAFADRHRRLG